MDFHLSNQSEQKEFFISQEYSLSFRKLLLFNLIQRLGLFLVCVYRKANIVNTVYFFEMKRVDILRQNAALLLPPPPPVC